MRSAAGLAAALAFMSALAGCIQVNLEGGMPPPSASTASPAPSRAAGLSLDFTWTPDLPRAGMPVRFQATVEGLGGRSVDEWTWDFGDNGSASGPAVTHTYAKPGDRTVWLRAIASDGTILQARDEVLVLGRGQAQPMPAPGGGNATANATTRPPPAVPGEFTCPEGPVVEPYGTFGRDDSLPGLAWAALKTGFRFAVAWSTESATTETLRFSVAGGAEQVVTETVPTSVHLFVLEGLPEGETVCFRAGSAPLHAARLANAMTSFQPAPNGTAGHGTYTVNLLVLSNEGGDLSEIEPGLERFAELLWDSTDGWVRAGAMLVVSGAPAQHNAGWGVCYIPGIDHPLCNQVFDAIVTEDAVPQGAASTYRRGVKDPDAAMWMNMHFQAMPGPLSMDDFGAVLLHEGGHYFFDMDDLYGDPVVPDSQACDLPEFSMSIMGGGRDTTEFDDELRRCPTQGPDYVPSWTLLRGQFEQVPARDDAVDPGPPGDGGLAFQKTYRGP